MKIFWYVLGILSASLLFCLLGCQQVGQRIDGALVSITTGQLLPVTVVSTSGLGMEPRGLKELEGRIRTECPTATLVVTHWSKDLESLVAKNWDGKQPLIVIGHSFGGGRSVYLVQRLAAGGKRVSLLYLLDPVPPPSTKPDKTQDFTLPTTVDTSVCYLRSHWQLFVATSYPIFNTQDGGGRWTNYTVDEAHNAIPDDDAIESDIITRIQSLARPELLKFGQK